MVDSSIVNKWIEKARKDLLIAKSDVKDPQRAEYVAFNCHQSAEKYLKAFTIANRLKFKYTHDLVILLQLCIVKDKNFEILRPDVEELTPFYIESRYPDFVGVITQKHAQLALKSVSTIAKFVEAKI